LGLKLTKADANATIKAAGHIDIVDLSLLVGASYKISVLSNLTDSQINITQEGVLRSITFAGQLPNTFTIKGGSAAALTPVQLSSSRSPFSITNADLAINGTAGLDTVSIANSHNYFSVSLAASNVTVIDVTGLLGTNTLINVERLSFTDGTLALDIAPGQNAGQAYRLYQAAFARTPDMPGVKYHLNDMESNGLALWNIASNFLASPEFATKYGQNPTDTQYINALYNNVLKRTPGGSEVAWYQNQFNTKAMDRQAALIGFSESPENVALVGSAIANGIWLG
jgi:hypothetical protein